ncbi:MAG: putative Ig domain-containing protein [Acidobacteria bacterium]|nr:putative Ig domain-containing protein [Acidobacteriota bacterium]
MARLLFLFVALCAVSFAQLSIDPPTLPDAVQGSTYVSTQTPLPLVATADSVYLDVVGAQGEFSFSYSISSGSLPTGMSLSQFGRFEGAPTRQGTFNFTVRAASGSFTVTRDYTLQVLPPFTIARTVTVGQSVEIDAVCPDYENQYLYSAVGSPPSALMVDPMLGTISGVVQGPARRATLRWQCQDVYYPDLQFRVDFVFDILGRPSLSYNLTVGEAFSKLIPVDGGLPPYSYRLASGMLPPGLVLNANSGLVSGAATAAGTYTAILEKAEIGSGSVYQTEVTFVVTTPVSFSAEPTSLSLRAVSDGPPAMGSIRAQSSLLGDSYSAVTRTTRGGNWLSVRPLQGSLPKVMEVRANPAGLPAGQYNGFIDLQSAAATDALGQAQIAVSFTVLPAEPDALTLAPSGLQGSFRQGGAPRIFPIAASNSGSGSIVLDAQTVTANGGPWLNVSPSTGTASGASPVTLYVTMDPVGLPPGTYKGSVVVNAPAAGGETLIPVTMTITGANGLLQLSRTGFSYRMEEGSNPPAGYTFIRESQGRSLSWRAVATTTSAGSWLVATPSSGTTGPQSLSNVVVSGSQLAPGRYFGQIQVSSTDAANSPQVATVALRVDPAGTALAPVPSEFGVAFASPPSSGTLVNRLTRGIQVANPTASVQTLQIATSFPTGTPFFNASGDGQQINPGEQVAVNIQASAASLSPGSYRGFLELAFESGGPTARVEVLLVVAQGAPNGPAFLSEEGSGPQQSACTPSKLDVIMVSPGDNFAIDQGLPVAIEAFVFDDCGNPSTEASVSATFSNGDDPVLLTRNSRGGYSGVWTPLRFRSGQASLKEQSSGERQQTQEEEQDEAQITIQANQLRTTGGTTQVGGSLSSFAGVPVISPGGAVSAASFAASNPLPPGGFISIFGGNLAPAVAEATSLPLPSQLSEVSVTAAGQPVPLTFVSPNQINGVLPFGLTADSAQQIVVKNGNALSTPEAISVSRAQPAVFTQSFSGVGPGIVVGVRPDGSQFLVGPTSRLSVGDAAVIYCAGLGLVDQEIDAADAAPGDPLARTVEGVSVTIGGVDASVFYAGLAPGFAGLYQVNAIVPAGTPSGADVPLVLTIDEIVNPTVTVAVQ